MRLFDIFRPVWTVRCFSSGIDFKETERNCWINPGYLWQARRSAEKLNVYGCADYFRRAHYSVVHKDYFDRGDRE